ncbi:putative transcription factor interactor and regulator CCHC(Zn) family [Helianthus annuus]|uniref:Transcription factor interactor and regulator CCHC(Zn) family n=1 Tax=Helianthus annuus TaxID=4232 RepID=A0A9K3NLK6_HELAN|nr:putative transcription factor interactor and regulator CCHC(Zn) family [Helianthus annuus]
MTQETSHSGFHGGMSSNTTSQGPSSSTSNQQQTAQKNVFQCNIAVDLKNGQNLSEESAKQQMIFLASVLESYEGLVAGKIGNTNLTKEDYDQIDPEEMELIDIRWAMASAVRRAQRFMEITGRKTIGGPSTKLGFDKSKVTCFKCKQKGHFKRECRNEYVDESANPFREDYYKKAVYHQNKSEPPRLKQIEEKEKEKSRALAVIHDDEGYDWSEILPEEDAVGYAFAAGKIVPFKNTRTEEEKFVNRRVKAQTKVSRIYTIYKEAKRAKRWDPDRECYLDPQGNIAIDPSSLSVDAIIQQYAEEEEARQREWWGEGEKKVEEKEEKAKSEEKKIDDGVIDTSQKLTAENLMKMADKVLAAKELEVDSSSGTESNAKVSQISMNIVSGKKDKSESDCKNCMKNCKDCSTIVYLNNKKVEDLTRRVREVENQILNRDKLLKALNDRAKELTEKIESDKSDIERTKKENEKLILENRHITEKFEKLKRTVKDSDDRNGKTTKENVQLTGVLRVKEELINKQLDEIAKLKLQYQEAKIENERIQLKLTSYNSASFVLQHIVPKPIGKNKAGEDVFSDGTGVGYHQVPPPVLNNFSKKKSGLINDDENSDEIKLPESIDVTFSASSSDDSVQTDIVKSMAESVLESDSNEDDGCFLDKYIPKQKSKNNLNEEPNLVMYKMLGSDKLFSDTEFLIENVNVNKLKNVYKLIEVEMTEVKSLNQTKRQMNFEKDKSYCKKPVIPPGFANNNRNNWSGGYQGGKSYQKKNVQNKKFVENKVFVNSSSSFSNEEPEIFSKSNKEFFEEKGSQPQSEGTSWVVDARTCFRCNQAGHIARKCTNLKSKTDVVENRKKKNDKKEKDPLIVEKKGLKNDNTKVKTEPVKKMEIKNGEFYKRVATTQQTWKPKDAEMKAIDSKSKVSELEKQSSSTTSVKMNVPEKKRIPLSQQVWKPKSEKEISTSEVKKSEESITVDYDANFPPLKAENFKIQIARVKVTPKADEAWVDSMFD